MLPGRLREGLVNRATRERLPDERRGVVKKIKVGQHKYYVRTGEYEDGRVGEVFLTCDRTGDSTRGLLDAVATAVSLGLQSGVSIDDFCAKFEGTRFSPSFPGAGSSPLDAVFRYLRERYGARSE